MNPYYEADGITLYHGDCRDILPALVRADLILTDPPYGLGDRWTGGTWGNAPMYKDAKKWDRDIPTDVVVSLPQLADAVIIWGGNLYPLPPSRAWLAWEKSSKISTMADLEFAWTSLDRPAKMWKEDRNPDGKRQHPTQKPLSLMEWCLGFAPGSTLVLDPFSGSGTTLVAAKNLGRRAIGIEIDERYCEIAARRLDQGVLSLGVPHDSLYECPQTPEVSQEGEKATSRQEMGRVGQATKGIEETRAGQAPSREGIQSASRVEVLEDDALPVLAA